MTSPSPDTSPTREMSDGTIASWQQKRRSAASLRRRRLAAAFGLLALLSLAFIASLFQPFRHPQVHLIVLSGKVEADLWPQELPSIRPVTAAPVLLSALQSWAAATGLPAPLEIPGLGSGQTLDQLFQRAASTKIHSSDVALCIVQSHIATFDDSVYLVDRLDPSDPLRGRIPFQKICGAFSASRAGVKLICLDGGRIDADPRSGMTQNKFGELLRQAVQKTGDPNLWVFVSHADGQQSQWAQGKSPTVFLDAVIRAMGRDADQNADRRISLVELVNFVQHETTEYQRSARLLQGTQTPWLVRGSGRWSDKDLEVTLAPVPRGGSAQTAPAASVENSSKDESREKAKLIATVHSASSPEKRPVLSMTVPELLHEAWELRDELDRAAPDDHHAQGLRPSDYAPCHWNQLLAELIQAEAIWTSQPSSFPPRIHLLLQLRTADLRTLSSNSGDPGSDWLNAVRKLQPRKPGEIPNSLSLALAERWLHWSGQSQSDQLTAERTLLDTLRNAVDAKPMSDWIASNPSPTHAELQFARNLTKRAELDWIQIQSALRVRCEAEELASQPIAVRWFAEDLSRADRLRHYGERKLTEAVRPSDTETARQSLTEASSIYQQLATATARLALAERLKNELLSGIPHWMALSRNPSLTIQPSLAQELRALIPELEELIVALANARSHECGRIEPLCRGLQQRQSRLQALLFPDSLVGGFRLIESSTGELRLLAMALLETPLPTATQRRSLHVWLSTPTPAILADPLPPPRVRTCDFVARKLDLQLESLYSQLLQPLQQSSTAEGGQEPGWSFRTGTRQGKSNPSSSASSKSVDADAWGKSHIVFPGQLRKSLELAASASQENGAKAWFHALRLIDARDSMPHAVENCVAVRCLENVEQMLQWQWKQANLAQSDASENEAVSLRQRTGPLRLLMAGSSKLANIPMANGAFLVKAPESVELNAGQEHTVSLVVQNPLADAASLRYVVDYDPAFLTIETSSEICRLTAKDSRADFQMPPYERVAPSARSRSLPGLGQDELHLKLRGNLSERPTRIVVHVVSDVSTIRQDIPVQLPALALGVVRTSSSRNSALVADARELRPFANRSTNYTLSLEGLRQQVSALDVTAYRVTSTDLAWPLTSTMPSVDLQRWLSQSAAVQEVATLRGVPVTLGAPAPLLFPALKADSAVTRDLAGGLLIVMTDPKNQLSTWQHLRCLPLRPSAYLEAEVDYDAARDSLRIAVRPREGMSLPSEGIPVRYRIVERPDQGPPTPLRFENSSARTFSSSLQADRREVVLSVPYQRRSRSAYVLIDVDNWPRAFVFEVNQDGASPASDFAVEILEPKRRSAVRAPVESIPVKIAITSPARISADAFCVDVGIDRDGNRRLDGEPTLRLPADRQSEVLLESIDASGSWSIRSSVRDWTVSLPTRGLADQWGAVLARITHGSQENWSSGTQVVFDKSGPVLSRVVVSDGGEPVVGSPVRITALADDAGLSGVAHVAAGFDPSGLGVLSAGMKMVDATAGSDGEWVVTVPTKDVPAGPAVIVLQATDLAGNPGPVKTISLRFLTAEQAAAKIASRTSPVLGTVQYAGEAVRDADVQLTLIPPKDAAGAGPAKPPLTTKTNRWGQFAFDSVPPGDYELSAKGSVRGFRYENKTPVTVAPSKELDPVKLVFGKPEK